MGIRLKNCCLGNVVGCTYCPDSTSYQYDVTFSGVVMASSCINNGFVESGYATSGSLDGTYRLTRDAGDPCIWRGTASIVSSIWAGAECSGSPSGTTTACNITLTRTQEAGVNGWRLTVIGTGSGYGGYPTVQYFQGGLTASTNCSSGLPSILNLQGVLSLFMGTYWFGKDGTASLAIV